jgi:hypothetical protein
MKLIGLIAGIWLICQGHPFIGILLILLCL